VWVGSVGGLTLGDEVEAEGELALEDLDLAALLLERQQVVADPVARGVPAVRVRRRQLHLHLHLHRGIVWWDRSRRNEREETGKRRRRGRERKGIAVGASRILLLFLQGKKREH
jgi:hypothetical protein